MEFLIYSLEFITIILIFDIAHKNMVYLTS